MGNTIKHANQSNIEYYNLFTQECKANIKNRSNLKEILKREWVHICIKQTEKRLFGYDLNPINFIINMLDIEELTEKYTQFLTKWNCNNLDSSDFFDFNQYINIININNNHNNIT